MLKIHGKCDEVMRVLMEELNIQIPVYERWGSQAGGATVSIQNTPTVAPMGVIQTKKQTRGHFFFLCLKEKIIYKLFNQI